MIPPVEERSVRPCAYMYYGCCMHYDDYHETCRMGETAFSNREEAILCHPVSKMPLNTEENQNLFDEVNKQAAKEQPCKYNISRNEFRELIDSGLDVMGGYEITDKPEPINPVLKAWYEEDIAFIDSLLTHLKPGTPRYDQMIRERERRIEIIDSGAV